MQFWYRYTFLVFVSVLVFLSAHLTCYAANNGHTASDELLPSASQKPTWIIVPMLLPLQQNVVDTGKPIEKIVKTGSEDLPTDVTDPLQKEAILFLQQHALLPSFKGRAFQPELPVTFAEWDTLLYDVMNEKSWFLSEDPYYPDMPTTHWAFLVYERFRLRQWLNPYRAQTGKMTPDKLITIHDVMLSIAQSLQRFTTFSDPGYAKTVLERYKFNATTLSEADILPIATVLSSGFAGLAKMDMGHVLSRGEAVELAYQRYVMAQDNWMSGDVTRELPELLPLKFRSTSVLFQTRMEVGLPLYFVLTEPVAVPSLSLTLPAQSRLFGQVDTVELEGDLPVKTHVRLNQLVLPNGQTFILKAAFDLTFPKDSNGYLPAETIYNVTTEPVYAKAR